MKKIFKAGAAVVDITPENSQFLFGYPHVQRYSTGIHDPLLSSALYLSYGSKSVMFVANDIIFVGKDVAKRARERIAEVTDVPGANIMITATHTHSGPITVDYISNEADMIVPRADKKYVQLLEDAIVAAAIEAYEKAQPAQLGLAIADDTGLGTNRRDPSGPADHQVPVLMVQSADGKTNIACMLVCSMHPTVLHEDSTLLSGDFPGLARACLQQNVLSPHCPVLHHTGPAGNQSPRHMTNANTFDEAGRLGQILGRAVAKVIPAINYTQDVSLQCCREFVDLPQKNFPDVNEAQVKLDSSIQKLDQLRKNNAAHTEIRTAQCDWFGAEETLTLAKAARDGRLENACQSCLPAEIQIIQVGPWNFVGWQGEIFIEYSLAVKAQCDDTFVISLANGELQGYIVTEEALAQGGYEASNALFAPVSGQIMLDKTLEMLKA